MSDTCCNVESNKIQPTIVMNLCRILSTVVQLSHFQFTPLAVQHTLLFNTYMHSTAATVLYGNLFIMLIQATDSYMAMMHWKISTLALRILTQIYLIRVIIMSVFLEIEEAEQKVKVCIHMKVCHTVFSYLYFDWEYHFKQDISV